MARKILNPGKVTFLRAHDVGTGWGDQQGGNFLDVEAVFMLNSERGKAFGFQLRDDNNRPARQGMLDLLRDAFNHNWTVTGEYDERGNANPPNLGEVLRLQLVKP